MKAGLGLMYLAIVVFLLIGEVKCIVKFVTSDFKPDYKAEIIYGIGMVTYGGVIGWFDIGEHKK